MTRLKMFFVSAALLLVTVGVFAGKKKFASVTGLYVNIGGSSYSDITTGTANDFQTGLASGNQATVSDPSGSTFGLYTYSSVNGYIPVYTASPIP